METSRFIMKFQRILLSFIFLSSFVFIGCGNPAPTANEASTTPIAAKTPESDEMINAAPTLTPVFKAYCQAWVNNDEAALRKVYSQDTIEIFEEQMKEEKIDSLMKFLEVDKVSGKVCEVRNETINGNTAIAEIRSDIYPNGIKVVFVKEGSDWKMTNRSPNSITQQQADPARPAANN